MQDIRKEFEEFKASANAQITSLKEEVATLRGQLPN